jgi:cell division septation protein DedD
LPPGAFAVQLAAARSEDQAMAEWKRVQGQHAAAVQGLTPLVVRADLGKRGVFFRLRAGPLADRAAADTVCAALKAANEACIVVRP